MPSAVCGHREKIASYEPGSMLLSDTKSAIALILDSSATSTLRNKFLLFISHPVYSALIWQLKVTKAPPTLLPGIQRQCYVESGHVFFCTIQSAYLCTYSTQFSHKSRLLTNKICKVRPECTLTTLLLYFDNLEKKNLT